VAVPGQHIGAVHPERAGRQVPSAGEVRQHVVDAVVLAGDAVAPRHCPGDVWGQLAGLG
jgi:hypothetical protein